MEFLILGSFEIVGSAGALDLRGVKRRGLLACLVVHAGQPISTDRLVEELWGTQGSDGAARTVQTYVSHQLRRLFRGEQARLTTQPGGYMLEVDACCIDAYRFEQGVTAARAEPDAARRLATIDEALVLWRGRPLGEFSGAGWADREAARLEALHLRAVHSRCDALMDLDRAAEAIVELEPLVDAHPLDERLWARLMVALYRGHVLHLVRHTQSVAPRWWPIPPRPQRQGRGPQGGCRRPTRHAEPIRPRRPSAVALRSGVGQLRLASVPETASRESVEEVAVGNNHIICRRLKQLHPSVAERVVE